MYIYVCESFLTYDRGISRTWIRDICMRHITHVLHHITHVNEPSLMHIHIHMHTHIHIRVMPHVRHGTYYSTFSLPVCRWYQLPTLLSDDYSVITLLRCYHITTPLLTILLSLCQVAGGISLWLSVLSLQGKNFSLTTMCGGGGKGGWAEGVGEGAGFDWCVAVCCSVLQSVSSVLQSVAVCCSVLQCVVKCSCVLQCVATCCSVLQCVAGFDQCILLSQCVCVCACVCVRVWCEILPWRSLCDPCVYSLYMGLWRNVAVCCGVLQCVAGCCNVLHVASCCILLQRVAVRCSVLQRVVCLVYI